MSRSNDSAVSWFEILKPQYLSAIIVLAGGIALYAINEFGTSSVLPTLVRDIGGEEYFAWATSLFIVASVISSIFVPNALASWGPRKVYLVAISIQILGSAICAFAPHYAVFLVGRVFQGISGGLLSALGYTLIRAVLPEGFWALGTVIISLMWAIGTVCGPAIGGLAVQLSSWRWAFIVILFIAIGVAILVPISMPRQAIVESSAIPMPVLSVVIVSFAAIFISLASVISVKIYVIGLLIAAMLALALLYMVERRARIRILPVSAFMPQTSTPWLYGLVAIVTACTAYEIYIPKFSQDIGGASPLIAGFVGATLALGWTFLQIPSAKVRSLSIIAWLMVGGMVLMFISVVIMFISTRTLSHGMLMLGIWSLLLLFFGGGTGMIWPHLASLIFASGNIGVEQLSPAEVHMNEHRAASSVSTIQLMANAIGAALAGLWVNFGHDSVQQSQNVTLGFGGVTFLGVMISIVVQRKLSAEYKKVTVV